MAQTVLIGLCCTVFVYDLLFRRVPNWILLATLIAHVGIMWSIGEGWQYVTARQSLLGAGIALAFFVPLYALRAMGAGDVKFFTLLGAMMGPFHLFPLWLIASVLAGVHAIVLYISNRDVVPVGEGWYRWKMRLNENTWYQTMMHKRAGRKGIPYAAYLAAAAIAIMATG